MHDFDDLFHAGPDVIHAADIHFAVAALAKLGEPQAAMLVEDEVVRSAQTVLAAFGYDGFDLAALQVHTLDRAALIVIRLRARHDHVAGRDPAKTAIVADVHFSVRPERGAVRPA